MSRLNISVTIARVCFEKPTGKSLTDLIAQCKIKDRPCVNHALTMTGYRLAFSCNWLRPGQPGHKQAFGVIIVLPSKGFSIVKHFIINTDYTDYQITLLPLFPKAPWKKGCKKMLAEKSILTLLYWQTYSRAPLMVISRRGYQKASCERLLNKRM